MRDVQRQFPSGMKDFPCIRPGDVLCSPRNAQTREHPRHFVNRPEGVQLPLLRQRASLGIAPFGTGHVYTHAGHA